MTIDLDELERLAKAAKKGKRQGEWAWEGRTEDEGYVHIPQGSTLVGFVQLGDTYEGYQADCDFMQAATPWAVLALVARVRKAEEALGHIKSECDSAMREAEHMANPSGQHVPYHGAFASVLRFPSVVRDLKRQAEFIGRVLKGET